MYAFPSKGNGQMIKTDGMWKKKAKSELQNVTDMTDISVPKNWQVGETNLGGPKISKNKPLFGRFVQQV